MNVCIWYRIKGGKNCFLFIPTMKIFSGNNEYRRFYESIDMIPTSNVESSQKPRGGGESLIRNVRVFPELSWQCPDFQQLCHGLRLRVNTTNISFILTKWRLAEQLAVELLISFSEEIDGTCI